MNADELDQKPAENLTEDQAIPRLEARNAIPEVAAPKRSSSGLAALALLVALLALAAAGWMWLQSGKAQQAQLAQWQTQQQQLQVELKRLETALAKAQDAASQQSGTLGSELQQRVQAVESAQKSDEDFRSETGAWNRSAQAALEDTQARLDMVDDRLRSLTARSAQSDLELELEEIDYLLRMAQERLQLFGDTRNADRALQLADQQVLAFDNPLFIALRREIAAARQALAAADVPDMVTLGAELDKLQDSLATLPFKTSEYEAEVQLANTGTEQSWWQRLKNSLAGLVTVRRVADDELALPALADQQALRQRAWLQLEQARLAALSREQDLYLDALSQAEATITRWFAVDGAPARLSLSALQALQQRNVNPPMPDISGPWTTLRSIRDAGLSPAVPTSAPAKTETAVVSPKADQAEAAVVSPKANQAEAAPIQESESSEIQSKSELQSNSELQSITGPEAESAPIEPETDEAPSETTETDQ